jgi:hypothetical protein
LLGDVVCVVAAFGFPKAGFYIAAILVLFSFPEEAFAFCTSCSACTIFQQVFAWKTSEMAPSPGQPIVKLC